jgi:hypothetical protein
MRLELELADRVAETMKSVAVPLHQRIAALEARPPARDGAPGRDGEKGLVGPPGLDGAPGRDGEKGIDGSPGRDGVGLAGAFIDREGHLTLTLSDGTTKDIGTVVGPHGPAGAKGADGLMVEPVAALSPEIIIASVDMLLRKELASLEAAAPPRMTKRIIRDARGKIERVIEEPARG